MLCKKNKRLLEKEIEIYKPIKEKYSTELVDFISKNIIPLFNLYNKYKAKAVWFVNNYQDFVLYETKTLNTKTIKKYRIDNYISETNITFYIFFNIKYDLDNYIESNIEIIVFDNNVKTHHYVSNKIDETGFLTDDEKIESYIDILPYDSLVDIQQRELEWYDNEYDDIEKLKELLKHSLTVYYTISEPLKKEIKYQAKKYNILK